MTTEQVANRFFELSKEGKFDVILYELYSNDCVSFEPDHGVEEGLTNANGLVAIRLKGQKFNESIEAMHVGYTGEPIIGGTHFSLAMGMDVTMKGRGREKMDEICVYEVKDGKIVKEQFFY